MLGDHEIDAHTRNVGLFARLGEEDDVAIEWHSIALEQQHGHQIGGEVWLIVSRAAAPDVAVFHDGRERLDGPLFA